MESTLQRYWLFGLVCFSYSAVVLWLLMRRRITLQSSLTYLLMLLALGGFSFILPYRRLHEALGFQLPSNLFFVASIGALSFLHLMALTTLSRLELRSITLTQEVALIQEELERNEMLVRDLAERLATAGGLPEVARRAGKGPATEPAP